MYTRRFILFISIILCCSGCFSSVPKAASPVVADQIEIPTGKIVNREVFSKGGTLVVLPFKAGVGVSANQQMDRMSMMIAKGAIDYLVEQKTPFTILTTQDQGNPDLIIEGYIEDIDSPGKVGRLVLRQKQTTLHITGQMVMSGTKERVMIFQNTKTMPDPKRDGLEIAYQMGQDLGRFIADATNGE